MRNKISYLILSILGQQPVVGGGAHDKQMRGQRAHDLPVVLGHGVQAVVVGHPVGVDGHEDGADVGVDVVVVVAEADVPEDRGLVEVGERDHVGHPVRAEVLAALDLRGENGGF